jgi:hypothetical protein
VPTIVGIGGWSLATIGRSSSLSALNAFYALGQFVAPGNFPTAAGLLGASPGLTTAIQTAGFAFPVVTAINNISGLWAGSINKGFDRIGYLIPNYSFPSYSVGISQLPTVVNGQAKEETVPQSEPNQPYGWPGELGRKSRKSRRGGKGSQNVWETFTFNARSR